MDTLFPEFPKMTNNFKIERVPISCSSSRNFVLPGFDPINPHPISSSIQPPSSSSCVSSSGLSSEGDVSNLPVLKYINDILMEEDLERKTCMLQDCLALQSAEKPFYDVLGKEYPYKPCDSPPFSSNSNQNLGIQDDDDDGLNRSSSAGSSSNSQSTAVCNWNSDQSSLGLKVLQDSLVVSPESTLSGPHFSGDIWPSGVVGRRLGTGIPLPKAGSFIAAHNANPQSTSSDEEEKDLCLRGKKNHQREEGDRAEDERSNKQLASSLAEPEASVEMFDEVLLCKRNNFGSPLGTFIHRSENGASPGAQTKGSSSRKSKRRKRTNKGEVVDLWTLLTQCAQAVAGSDHRTANELLKQIKQHSSAQGEVNQRLAHYFAIALETRLDGTSKPTHSTIVSTKTKMVDILKAYSMYIRACPFHRMSYYFANRTILKQAENASRLHIIDFGVLYGFQWPCLIQRLSERSNGPPKLKITAVDLPQPGFRPAERVNETVQRLKKYSERFNVPFECHVIAKKWETIKYEDLNIDRDEMTIVNCIYRLKNIPDDTVAANSARDTVLNLINKINPELFLLGVVNGNYYAPFFLTRFKEALFYFSSYFDMLEVTVSRDDKPRMLFEKEILGRDLLNVVACEGSERIERPETYKQWQTRNMRAGFRQVPLDRDILQLVRDRKKADYHKDFIFDEDGRWLLQGWKGRITHALSVWKPV